MSRPVIPDMATLHRKQRQFADMRAAGMKVREIRALLGISDKQWRIVSHGIRRANGRSPNT